MIYVDIKDKKKDSCEMVFKIVGDGHLIANQLAVMLKEFEKVAPTALMCAIDIIMQEDDEE